MVSETQRNVRRALIRCKPEELKEIAKTINEAASELQYGDTDKYLNTIDALSHKLSD